MLRPDPFEPGTAPDTRPVIETASCLGIELVPLDAVSGDLASARTLAGTVGDAAVAAEATRRLRDLPQVESAFVKPTDELP